VRAGLRAFHNASRNTFDAAALLETRSSGLPPTASCQVLSGQFAHQSHFGNRGENAPKSGTGQGRIVRHLKRAGGRTAVLDEGFKRLENKRPAQLNEQPLSVFPVVHAHAAEVTQRSQPDTKRLHGISPNWNTVAPNIDEASGTLPTRTPSAGSRSERQLPRAWRRRCRLPAATTFNRRKTWIHSGWFSRRSWS